VNYGIHCATARSDVETDDKWKVVHYLTAAGVDPFDKWTESLTQAIFDKIIIRLKRVAKGSFGDHGPVGDGVSELREHPGAGHRVYYGRDGDTVVLLTGGIKKTQAKDIARAKAYWKDYNDA
jgi:putative addiction module killer protein